MQDSTQHIEPDLTLPYAKLARHITAIYEIVRLAPTNDYSQPNFPPMGLSSRDRHLITEHLRLCLEMICSMEKWMLTPIATIPPLGASLARKSEDGTASASLDGDDG